MARKPVISTRRISRDEYVHLPTGEVRQYQPMAQKKQNKNLSKTFAKLRGLIRTNFSEGAENQLFVTLTYAENMQDPAVLYDDFKTFMKRLRYAYPGHKLDYITVAEPQGRGAWHMHVMLKSDQDYLMIPNEKMASLWGHGFTKTERLVSDDVGAYYVAYFTDLREDGKSKKGGRLHMYPPTMKLYRISRGIRQPEKGEWTYDEIREEYGEPVHTYTYIIEDEENNMLNTVQRMTFNKNRGEKPVKGGEAVYLDP